MTGRDPRWHWVEVDDPPCWIRAAYRHVDVAPVDAGETIARLCLTCGAQLPEEWTI